MVPPVTLLVPAKFKYPRSVVPDPPSLEIIMVPPDMVKPEPVAPISNGERLVAIVATVTAVTMPPD